MLSNIETLTTIFVIVIIVILILLAVLAIVYFTTKNKKSKKEERIETSAEKADVNKKTKTFAVESVMDFMEFDRVEDNMIVQKNGAKYIMVVECQGINYDLMSEVEKNGVEEGFIQFLNTLRHPIQIYVQTRTINLESSLQTYKDRVKQIEENLQKQEMQYREMQSSGNYTKEQVDKAYYELTKQRNLTEYGKDIIYTTEKMSLNKNVLNQKYYIVVPYYPEELGENDFDDDVDENLVKVINYIVKEKTFIGTHEELCSKLQLPILHRKLQSILSKNVDLLEKTYITYERLQRKKNARLIKGNKLIIVTPSHNI